MLPDYNFLLENIDKAGTYGTCFLYALLNEFQICKSDSEQTNL